MVFVVRIWMITDGDDDFYLQQNQVVSLAFGVVIEEVRLVTQATSLIQMQILVNKMIFVIVHWIFVLIIFQNQNDREI